MKQTAIHALLVILHAVGYIPVIYRFSILSLVCKLTKLTEEEFHLALEDAIYEGNVDNVKGLLRRNGQHTLPLDILHGATDAFCCRANDPDGEGMVDEAYTQNEVKMFAILLDIVVRSHDAMKYLQCKNDKGLYIWQVAVGHCFEYDVECDRHGVENSVKHFKKFMFLLALALTRQDDAMRAAGSCTDMWHALDTKMWETIDAGAYNTKTYDGKYSTEDFSLPEVSHTRGFGDLRDGNLLAWTGSGRDMVY